MHDRVEGALDPVRDKGTEASTESSGRLVCDALETAGLDNFTSFLDAVEDFLTHLQLFDPNVAFGRAAFALNDAAATFDSRDGNSDQRLSRQELSRYAGKFEGNDKQYFEWILSHYDSIEKPSQMVSARKTSNMRGAFSPDWNSYLQTSTSWSTDVRMQAKVKAVRMTLPTNLDEVATRPTYALLRASE